jgi:polar amino acid transport system substrate-binding protein
MANAAEVIDAVVTGKADIGFLAYEAERASQVDFSEPYAVMQNAYLVRADSPIKQSSDVDRAGVTVGAVKGQSQQIFVSSTFKSARVEVLPLMPSPEAIRKMLASGEVNGFAANRARMEAVAAGFPEVRVLSDNFLSLGQAIVVPKGDTTRMRVLNAFVADVRRTGLVKSSLDSSGIVGLDVIP